MTLFFFNDTATTEIYTLSLHDALPIYAEAFDQAAEHGEQAKQHQIELQRRQLHADDEFGQLLADARETDRVGEHIGRENQRSEEHTSELQSPCNLVCRLLLEQKRRSFS